MKRSRETVMDPGFDILFEDGPCLVVAKPGGLLTQAPPQIDSLELRVKRFLKQRDAKPGRVYLGVPHRLDRPASGALVLGLHARAARRLAEQFEGRTVGKTYWVLVEGRPDALHGTWTDRLRKVPDEARAEVVSSEHPEGKLARLRYRVLQVGNRHSWLEIELETGRTHQIRVQAASRGLPIVGDHQYGARIAFGPASDDERQRWIALHARSIRFRHPMTGQPVNQTAPLPAPWEPWSEPPPPSTDDPMPGPPLQS